METAPYINTISIIAPLIIGAIGFFWGIHTYRVSQKARRQEILVPLIHEMDTSGELFLAKAILDDFTCYVPTPSTNTEVPNDFINPDTNYYNRKNLTGFLRNHLEESAKPIVDTRERAVRASFDTLIAFYYRLQYLHQIGLIKDMELDYFKYYAHEAFEIKENKEPIWNYIDKYGLPLDRRFIQRIIELKPYAPE